MSDDSAPYTSATTRTVSVACPHCSQPVIMNGNSPYRPFCSKRCKDIDFGGWAMEQYHISSDEDQDQWSDDDQR